MRGYRFKTKLGRRGQGWTRGGFKTIPRGTAWVMRARHAARTRRPGRNMLYYRGGSNVELKFHDLDIDDAVIAVGGTIAIDSVNKIAQGLTEVTRIGRKLTVKSINWRFRICLPTATIGTATSDTVRVILYLDKQANRATAAVSNILETGDFQSFNNLANKNRFRTLMDRTYTLNADISGDGTTLDTAQVETHDAFYKKCNIGIEYDDGSGDIGSITSGNIGVLLISSNGLAGFDSKMRIRFSDM